MGKSGNRRAKKEACCSRSKLLSPPHGHQVHETGGVPKHPGQATHRHSSANVRECQEPCAKKAQRQGQGRNAPGLTLARSRYNGSAHGLTNPHPGGAAKLRGSQPPAAGNPLPRSPQRGRRGREGRGGEPKGQPRGTGRRRTDETGSKRATHARSKKRARGQSHQRGGIAAAAPGRGAARPRSPEGGEQGGTGDRRRAQGRPRAQQGRPQEARSAARGSPSTATAASGRRAQSAQAAPERRSRGDASGAKGGGRAAPKRASRASAAQHGGSTRSGQKAEQSDAGAHYRFCGAPDRARERARRVWGFMPRWVPARCHATHGIPQLVAVPKALPSALGLCCRVCTLGAMRSAAMPLSAECGCCAVPRKALRR